MKYRRLTNDELKEARARVCAFPFPSFHSCGRLERMKTQDPDRVELLIEDFSDAIYAKILRDVKYLEHRSPKELRTFFFSAEKAFMLAIQVDGHSEVDFTKDQKPEEMLQLIQQSGASLRLHQAEKTYKKKNGRWRFSGPLADRGADFQRRGLVLPPVGAPAGISGQLTRRPANSAFFAGCGGSIGRAATLRFEENYRKAGLPVLSSL